MPQVCRHCKHVSNETGRYRCPNCKRAYDASQIDTPRPAVVPPPDPPPSPPAAVETPGPVAPVLPPPRPRREPPARIPQQLRPTPPSRPPQPEKPAVPKPKVQAGQTIGIEGFDISRLKIARRSYHIELPGADGEWAKLFSIVGTGRSPAFGRSLESRLQAMRWVAQKHVRFNNTSEGLFVEPYPSLNGVYRMIREPVELGADARFRVGNYVMTFRDRFLPQPGTPVAIEGEQLLARDLGHFGLIEVLRPDGQPGVVFPLLKRDGIVLGRGGKTPEGQPVHVDLPLADDPKVSALHARLRWIGADDERPVLEDLQSRSGTWVKIEDRTLVASGDVFWMGELYLRVVEAE